MRIGILTSNQPRHLSLIRDLSEVADEIFAVQECNTVFPGRVSDFFRKSEVMQKYFARVIDAERHVFGEISFLPKNVRQFAIKSGDLNMVNPKVLSELLAADLIVVFGASWIRGYLADMLIERKAINIHMGVSPYYRGNSCNFWALYDENPDLVGATVQVLTRGLDSGGMLFHSLPKQEAVDPFVFGMLAVRSAHEGLTSAISDGSLLRVDPVPQDRSLEIRYTRNADFTDEVAAEYLRRAITPGDLESALAQTPARQFVRLRIGKEQVSRAA